MPRPKSFDRTRVIDRAMRLFWEQGYAAASIHDLSTATGLQPGSLYAEFGSKHDLFLAVIDRYFSTILQDIFRLLEAPGSALEALHACLISLTERGLRNPPGAGCLMTNATTDRIMRDAEVAGRVTQYVSQMDEALYQVLARARQQEEMRYDGDLDLHALAHFLMIVIVGNNILIRTPLAPVFIPASIEVVLALLTK